MDTKTQTDKIIAYLAKLPEPELTRIASDIKRIRQSRRDKLSGAQQLDFNNG